MAICPRTSKDPLADLLLKNYQVNLITPPRQILDLGRIFAVDGQDIRDLPVERVLAGSVQLVEAPVSKSNVLNEKKSDYLMVSAGASLLGMLLKPFGYAGGRERLSAALSSNGAVSLRLEVKGLEIRRLNRDDLERSLKNAHFRANYDRSPTSLHYIVVGTWAATELDIYAYIDKNTAVDATAGVGEIMNGEAKISVKSGVLGQTQMKASEPAIFGIELMQLQEYNNSIALSSRKPEFRMRSTEANAEELNMLDVVSDDCFLELPEEE